MGFQLRRDQHKRRAGLPALLLATGGLWALANNGMTARADNAGRTVDVQVQDADLGSVINLLQRQTGLNFIIQNNGQSFGKVTVGLSHAPFDSALRAIVRSANGSVSRDADGVYVIRPVGVYGADTVSYSPSDASTNTAATLPTADYHWKKIVLLHAVPSDLLKLAHWDKDLVVPDPFRAVQMPDSPPNITASNGVQMLLPGYDNVPSVPVGRGNTGGLSANQSVQQANRSSDPSRQANQDFGAPTITTPGGGNFPGGGFPGGGRFRGNGGGFPQPFQQQQDPNADPNAPGGQTGRGSLPEGVDRIYAVEGDNSLLVYATPDGFAKVNDLVKALDVAPRQVQIKVEFVTASVADVDAFGLNFSLVPLPGVEVSNNQGTQANLTGNPQTYVQVATGNIVVQLFNTLVRTRGKVVQAPIITTTNNVPANINVSTQIPFVTTTNIVGGSGGTVTSNTQQQFLTITTGMVVQPRINADDTVTLNLSPTITDVAGAPSSAGGPPPTVRQSLTTLRTVKNGETMVLGGLVRKSETNSQSRIPFFADLPILGGLFRNRVTNISDSELLIFVTPTIINEDTEGPGTAAGLNTSVAP